MTVLNLPASERFTSGPLGGCMARCYRQCIEGPRFHTSGITTSNKRTSIFFNHRYIGYIFSHQSAPVVSTWSSPCSTYDFARTHTSLNFGEISISSKDLTTVSKPSQNNDSTQPFIGWAPHKTPFKRVQRDCRVNPFIVLRPKICLIKLLIRIHTLSKISQLLSIHAAPSESKIMRFHVLSSPSMEVFQDF